jgi:hypothetical protein
LANSQVTFFRNWPIFHENLKLVSLQKVFRL